MITKYKTLMKGGKKMSQIRNASDTTCKQLLRDEECFAVAGHTLSTCLLF